MKYSASKQWLIEQHQKSQRIYVGVRHYARSNNIEWNYAIRVCSAGRKALELNNRTFPEGAR